MREEDGCIIVGDRSSCHAYLHSDGLGKYGARKVSWNPLLRCARSSEELEAFNADHPLFGGAPVDVLVSESGLRRKSDAVTCHLCSSELPSGSFVRLRDRLYMATPELAYVRMAKACSLVQLAELGTNLCARFYLDGDGISDRTACITTPEDLRSYLEAAEGLRGRVKASKALRWVLPNSGSPMETKMQLQFRAPLWAGGFALPFDEMNYDISAKRAFALTSQSRFCIDLAATAYKTGLEYDGRDYHWDASKDKRRINALKALGWEIFPIDRAVLFDAEETERVAHQVARYMRIRIQKPKSWETKYAELRAELGLPV